MRWIKIFTEALESWGGVTYHSDMSRNVFRSGLVAALIAGVVFSSGPLQAEEPSVTVVAAAPVLARLASDPRASGSFSADLELHIKMRTFPFVGLTVKGTSDYRRPGQYHYQLRNLPIIASKFNELRYDLGDPVSWAVKYDISMAPESTDDVPVLRLTPKHPKLITQLDIVTDATRGRILKATWKRRDGGTIVVTQTYAIVDAADVVTEQHGMVDIPHFRADVSAVYTNVRLETATIATVPEH